jgi:hypothetical protein
MSNSNGYLPRTDLELENWLRNFATKLPTHATKYSISTAEVTDVKNSVAYFSYYLQTKNAFIEYSKKLKHFLEELKFGLQAGATQGGIPTVSGLGTAPTAVNAGFILRIRSIVGRIKSNLNYSIADGYDLGIEIPTKKKAKPNIDTIKPSISIKLREGKNGMDALEIWVKRKDNADFILLDVDTKTQLY